MTIGEASAVNTLASWILGTTNVKGPSPSNEQCIDALLYLTERANKALGAGWSPEMIRREWPDRRGDDEGVTAAS